ncbi:hypothetical protein Tco_0502359 [Tanacetum coccineum]
MSAFIREFRTTNELFFKERNNSLSELRFEVNGLSKVIDNALISNCEVKGVTTRGGKTTTQGIHNDNADIHTKEPLMFCHDKPVAPIEVHVENEPQKTKEQVVQPPIELQTPSIPFPRKLRNKKEEAQQRKFLVNMKQLHINLLFIEALAQMPKYAKFLKSLLTNKAMLEEACTVLMNEWCSVVLLNKLPSKEKDPGSFTIPCDMATYILIMRRPFLAIARAMIDVFNKKITLWVGDDEVIFDVDQSIKRPPAEDDECYDINDLDDTINIETQEVLRRNESDDKYDTGMPIRRINAVNTPYSEAQKIAGTDEVNSEHLYSTSTNKNDEKKLELKDLPHHLEYAYLHGSKSC